MEQQNKESDRDSDRDIELQLTIYTLAQSISIAFNVTYDKAKEILNEAIHNRDNNTLEIATQIYHIKSGD